MFDLARLIADLGRAAAGPAPEKALRNVITTACADPDAVARALPGDREGEDLLHADDAFTLYDVRLPPGILYPAHDHGMAAVIGLYRGREINLFYRETADGTLEEAARRAAARGEILPLGRDVIHAVANPGGTPSGGLHAYLGDLTRIERRLWPVADRPPVPFTETAYFAAACPLAAS
jgi:predicted metal-dependent enzyme (double-stranded beta helix superfamily)